MKACTGPEEEGEPGVVVRHQEAGSIKHQQQYLLEFVKKCRCHNAPFAALR